MRFSQNVWKLDVQTMLWIVRLRGAVKSEVLISSLFDLFVKVVNSSLFFVFLSYLLVAFISFYSTWLHILYYLCLSLACKFKLIT